MQQLNSREDCTRRRHRGADHDVEVDICSESAQLNDQFTMAQRSLLTSKTNQSTLLLLLLLSLARTTTSSDDVVQHDVAAPACTSTDAHSWLSDSSTQSFMAAAERLGIRCVYCCLHHPQKLLKLLVVSCAGMTWRCRVRMQPGRCCACIATRLARHRRTARSAASYCHHDGTCMTRICHLCAVDASHRHPAICQSGVQVPRQAALEVSLHREQSSPLPDSFVSPAFWDRSDRCTGLS